MYVRYGFLNALHEARLIHQLHLQIIKRIKLNYIKFLKEHELKWKWYDVRHQLTQKMQFFNTSKWYPRYIYEHILKHMFPLKKE